MVKVPALAGTKQLKLAPFVKVLSVALLPLIEINEFAAPPL